MKNVVIFGATGLVGSTLVEKLKQSEEVEKVVPVNRRSQPYSHEKVKEVITNYNDLRADLSGIETDCWFICLGTTMKKAGSKDQFKAVDYRLPVDLAKLASQLHVKTLIVVSSLGANSHASNFYLKVKGEMERDVSQVGPEQTYFVRPSMILGDRTEYRLGESIGKFLIRLLEPLMLGKLKKYRGITASQIAAAMMTIAKSLPKKRVFESEELKEITKA